jgi:hypothetical protein
MNRDWRGNKLHLNKISKGTHHLLVLCLTQLSPAMPVLRAVGRALHSLKLGMLMILMG